MIIILVAVVSSSLVGALLAAVQTGSVLAAVLGYVAGGWVGLVTALICLMLRPNCHDETVENTRSPLTRRKALGAPSASAVTAMRHQTR